MESFVQGTLNIGFSTVELPAHFRAFGLRSLDLNASFPPAIYRSGTVVPNNTIKPSSENPRRGDIQLWRSVLVNQEIKTRHKCYLIRRVESGYRDKAEILGQQDFRREVGFLTNHSVCLTVYAGLGETI